LTCVRTVHFRWERGCLSNGVSYGGPRRSQRFKSQKTLALAKHVSPRMGTFGPHPKRPGKREYRNGLCLALIFLKPALSDPCSRLRTESMGASLDEMGIGGGMKKRPRFSICFSSRHQGSSYPVRWVQIIWSLMDDIFPTLSIGKKGYSALMLLFASDTTIVPVDFSLPTPARTLYASIWKTRYEASLDEQIEGRKPQQTRIRNYYQPPPN
jgi:hypothetical protein